MWQAKWILILIVTLSTPIFSQDVEEMISTFENMTRNSRLLLPSFSNIDNNLYDSPPMEDDETFDFIIVGSGSAGSVLANRLSEIPHWKILLLEVGREPTFFSEVPFLAPLLQFTDYNWNYLMEKQDNVALGLENQRMPWPRGRGLGGTTLINFMIHVRGNPLDYERWSSMGNPGWSYKEVLPYFLKSEDATIQRQDTEYHEKGGYLSVTDVPVRTKAVDAFVEAAQEAGHPYVDYNGKSQLGVSYVQANLRQGRRCSGEKAFIRPVRDRSNLKILTNARVVKVLIDPETKTATGVKYVKNKRYRTAKASKEVILSAGAFNSPQLLMLSGVGPEDHLKELGIPVLQNLPVGEKLYDHISFIGLAFTSNTSIVFQQRDAFRPEALLDLILNGKGVLTSIGAVEALGYIKTNVSKEDGPFPDMELIFLGASLSTDMGQSYRKVFKLTDQIYNTVFKPLENKFVYQVIPMLIHPKSFGYLKLKSKNPYHWPKLYGNYFTDPNNEDIKTFIASIREVQRIVSMPALQRYGSKIVSTPIPGCESNTFDSDEYWECALRHITPTLHHQVATCKMGPRNDPEAVVDNKLRVYGIENLRVADTSIIPLPLAAHTNIPAYMVGEKAADLIKEEWAKPRYKIDPRSAFET